jgi:hypothetical protein
MAVGVMKTNNGVMSAGSKRNENVAWRQWRGVFSYSRRGGGGLVSPEASAKWPQLKRRSEMKEIGSWPGWRKRVAAQPAACHQSEIVSK